MVLNMIDIVIVDNYTKLEHKKFLFIGINLGMNIK